MSAGAQRPPHFDSKEKGHPMAVVSYVLSGDAAVGFAAGAGARRERSGSVGEGEYWMVAGKDRLLHHFVGVVRCDQRVSLTLRFNLIDY